MHPLRGLMTIATLALTAMPGQSAATTVASERLLVGRTNIFCVQAPCPWRGIASAERPRSGPADLLWSGDSLPRLEASVADATRLKAAWDDNECLAIDGVLAGSTLYVQRITGVCP